jgi:hypothetical protein
MFAVLYRDPETKVHLNIEYPRVGVQVADLIPARFKFSLFANTSTGTYCKMCYCKQCFFVCVQLMPTLHRNVRT